eukprot:6478196-Prymnesium_polylepis.2
MRAFRAVLGGRRPSQSSKNATTRARRIRRCEIGIKMRERKRKKCRSDIGGRSEGLGSRFVGRWRDNDLDLVFFVANGRTAPRGNPLPRPW